MKKREFFGAIVLIIIVIIILLLGGYSDTHYSVQADVYQIDIENNSVLLIDGAGYIWEVTDRPDLCHKGQSVKIYFNNNCTDHTREDDIIERVKALP